MNAGPNDACSPGLPRLSLWRRKRAILRWSSGFRGNVVGAKRCRVPRVSQPKSIFVSTKRARLLVVDDEPMLGQTLQLAFQEQHEVVVALTGREALERLQRDSGFDLILCDLMMPETSGIMVWQRVGERHPELLSKFVFMTGGAFTDSARDFLENYEGLRLEKPFNVRQVEQLLQTVTRRDS